MMLYDDPNMPKRPPEEDPIPPIQEQGSQEPVGGDANYDPVYEDQEQDVDKSEDSKESLMDRVKGFFDSLKGDGKPADHG